LDWFLIFDSLLINDWLGESHLLLLSLSLLSLDDSGVVTRERLQEVAHGVVCILLAHVLVPWQRVERRLEPGKIVGDTPSFEALAAWMTEANLEQLVVDLSLLLQSFRIPASFALDINLGEVDLNT